MLPLYMCPAFFFFFKQKTAYEMRISDWSSDVCSSDLPRPRIGGDEIGELFCRAHPRRHPVTDIRPVEPREHQPFGRNAELEQNILARVLVGGCRQREPRHRRKSVEQRPEQAVVRAKIMPPFGHAIDRKSTRLNSSH